MKISLQSDDVRALDSSILTIRKAIASNTIIAIPVLSKVIKNKSGQTLNVISRRLIFIKDCSPDIVNMLKRMYLPLTVSVEIKSAVNLNS